MRRIILTIAIIGLLSSNVDSQGFQNPILSGFHPDPSVCRVNDDFFLVTSSFQFFPGVPIFHSKDLIHWEQIGHCLTRESQLPLHKANAWGGIYAPTIRYNDGRFYMITTNCSDRGNFFVWTDNPYGEWSEPIWVEGMCGIDPTLYFEGDKVYYVGTCNDKINLCEIDIKTGKCLTEIKPIWQGTGGRYPEGPHIYKKDGYYYLLIAEGGTEYGHKVTIARSKNIYGPYESNNSNPILTHINQNAQSNPIQGLGHADFVQAPDSSWWVVCLGFRPQSYNHHLLGRETFLAPVVWEKGAWPVINGNGTISIDMDCKTLPQTKMPEETTLFNFSETKFDKSWNWLCNPIMKNYSLTDRKGWLRLKAGDLTLDNEGSPTFIGRRQNSINCQVTTCIEPKNLSDGAQAGLSVYMMNQYHYDLCLVSRRNKIHIMLRYRLGQMSHIETEIPLNGNVAYLRIEGTPDYYHFTYSTDGNSFIPLGKMDTRFLSSETAGGFTGIYIGLYAQGSDKSSSDFNWIDYQMK